MMSGDANESTATASQHHMDDGGCEYQQQHEEQHREQPHNSKRARYLDGWEACLNVPTQENRKPLGLSDLFGASDKNVHDTASSSSNPSTLISRPPQTQDVAVAHAFFSLRLEHREGGAMARHPGEERILLFRSDRPGAIAKIIYSSTPGVTPMKDCEINNPEKHQEEENNSMMVQAKIHVLDVKEEYRGFDLGSLLFTEALAFLRRRYMEDPEEDGDDDKISSYHDEPSSFIHCQLDAEEDVRRHNKLVGFYETLGCHVKPNVKVLYLNNNDGSETYRKVPMQITITIAQQKQQQNQPKMSQHGRIKVHHSDEGSSLVQRRQDFVPVVLLVSPGKRSSGLATPVSDTNSNVTTSKVYWLMMEDNQGHVEFRTTKGQYLRVSPDGHCEAAILSEDKDQNSSNESQSSVVHDLWSKFDLFRVAEETDKNKDDVAVVPHEAHAKSLWLLRSTSHGTFLTLNASDHLFHCSKTPSFWQADSSGFRLLSTTDTPLRRQHYRKQWTKQTVDYVRSMRERYFKFDLTQMDLWTALNLAHKLPAYRFGVERNVEAPSLRTRCFRTAELFRNAGHPDWVQLIALVYNLAGVANLIDMVTAVESENDYDWTISSRGRVVGCTPPASITFGEYRSLNADEYDPTYNSLQGMYDLHCGFDNVLLAWTGPEYMYYMLKHNEVNIPDEGLKMLRLASLYDWHTNNAYSQFATEDDEDVQMSVADFDELIRAARDETRDCNEMCSTDCEGLWKSHYADIATKYGADGNLMW
jgi:inositol oxygenase